MKLCIFLYPHKIEGAKLERPRMIIALNFQREKGKSMKFTGVVRMNRRDLNLAGVAFTRRKD